MNKEGDFEIIVKQHFGYLTEEYGFTRVPNETSSRQIVIAYEKVLLQIRIIYSHTNSNLYIKLINRKFSKSFDEENEDNVVSLVHIMMKKKEDFDYWADYDSIMPSRIPIEESVKKVAELVKKYSHELLSGKEWFSWSDVTGNNAKLRN